MASANFDALHLRLARKIQDVVAAAADNGGQATSADRTDYLNRANVLVQHSILSMGWAYVDRYLGGLKATQTINTWSSSGTSVASDYQIWIEAQYDTTPATILAWHPSKIELDAGVNPNLKNAFTIQAGKVYGYYNGTILNAGTGKLVYLSNDKRASNGDTSDIQIDAIWYDVIVEIAAALHFEATGDLQRAQVLLSQAMSDIKQIAR